MLHVMVLAAFVEGVDIAGVSVGRIVVVLAVLVTLTEILSGRRVPRAHPAVVVPAGALTTCMLLSSFWATDQSAWQEAVLELALALGFFLAYVTLIDSRDRVRSLLLTYALGATASAMVGLLQIDQETRAVGLQGDPNTYALYTLAALPITAELGRRARPGRRLLWLVASALQLAAIFGSQSRGALLGLAVVAGWILLTSAGERGPARDARVVVGVIGVAPLLAAVVTLFPRLSPQRVLEDRGTGRLDIWITAWRAWQEQPLVGLGAGNFEARSGDLLSHTPGVQLSPYSQFFEGIRVHNAYLEPLVELGPAGLVSFLALLVGGGLLLLDDRRRRPRDLTVVLLPILTVFAVTTIFLSITNNKLLWLLLGLAAVLPYLPDHTRTPEAPRPRALEVP